MRSRSEQHLTNLLTEKILRIIGIQSQNLKEKKHNMAAKVIKEKCIACGACVDACPVDAIKLADVAVIDEETCIDCGTCTDQCPSDAIEL